VKIIKFALLFTTKFALLGCEWGSTSDYLEVYFGVLKNNSAVNDASTFFYEGDQPINFSLSDEVYIRFDFLYIPNDQTNKENLIVKFLFDDNDSFFLSPILGQNLESQSKESDFCYLLPLQVNTYSTFIFSIEVLEITEIVPQLMAPITMEHVSSNQLNQEETLDSQVGVFDVIQKGKRLNFNQLNFQ
jgi:hypothetical protein